MTRPGLFILDREMTSVLQAEQEPVSILDIFRDGIKESVEAGKQELWNKLFGGTEKVQDDELMGPPTPSVLTSLDNNSLIFIGIILAIFFLL